MIEPYYSHAGITIYHGDCLKVMPQLEPGVIDMVMTDPPYGTTACSWDSIIPLEPMWANLKRLTKKNAAIVMTASQPFTTTLISSNMKAFKYCWVWRKSKPTGFPNANKQPLRNYEDACVFYNGQCDYFPQGLIKRPEPLQVIRKKPKHETINSGENDGSLLNPYLSEYENFPTQVVGFDNEGNILHPTQKPVALMSYLIRTYTNEGDLVLDFTMGSGTTLVAAKETGRMAIGIEREEKYCEIAVKRLSQETLFNAAMGGVV